MVETIYKIALLSLLGCNNISSKYKNSELTKAVFVKNIQKIEQILERGSNINAQDDYGYVALVIASRSGFKEIVKHLIDKGADINKRDNEGVSALIGASINGSKELVELLLDRRSDIEASDSNGNTSLIQAAINGDKEIVKYLLDKGANIFARNINQDTALVLSADYGHKEVVELLLNEGADINDRNSDGKSVLMAAFENGNEEIIKLLLDRDTNLSIKNIDKKTILDLTKDNYSLNKYSFLFDTFKNVIRDKVVNRIESLHLQSALQLLTQFKDTDSIPLLIKGIENMTVYYNQSRDCSLFKLKLAIARLKTPMLFNYTCEIKQKYIRLIKEIILYGARSADLLNRNSNEKNIKKRKTHNLKLKDAKKRANIKILKSISYGLSSITCKVDNEFLMKENLPEDVLNNIISFFSNS